MPAPFKIRKAVTSEVEQQPEEDAVVAAPSFNGEQLQADIQKLLGYATFAPKTRYYLDTKDEYLNGVFGSKALGIPYGKVVELGGEEHAGKTTLSQIIGSMAQRDGAAIGRIDLEDSRDDAWDIKCGLDPKSILNFWPKLIVPKVKKSEGEENVTPIKAKKKKKQPRGASGLPYLQSAEELFNEAEIGMAKLAAMGFVKQFWIVDSVANIMPEMVIDAGTAGQNMRTRGERSVFLSGLLPKWAALAANYNAIIFLLNQLRERPGVMFGDPTYTTGGRALRHGCSIRARVRRCKSGEVKKGSRVIGLVGVLTNKKNKAGGGSNQNAKAGFRLLWNRPVIKVEFMTVEEAEKLVSGGV
jgi:RecA/RadA recombinase